MPEETATGMPERHTLDLNGPITRDQYTDAVKDLIAFLDGELTHRNGWCSERYRYFEAIIPDFHYNYSLGSSSFDFDELPEDTDYAARLREMRARVLWYAKAGTISLDVANEIFSRASLPLYGVKPEAHGVRLQVTLPPFNINVTGSLDEARTWVFDNFTDFVARLLDGKPAQDSDRYVPGSAVIPEHDVRCYVAPERITIDEADTIRPSYTY